MTRTPVRDVPGERHPDGYVVLSEGRVSYEDGAEQRLLQIVRGAADRSCSSDELASAAAGWAEQYHLSRARPNFLRAIELPSGPILEIGAGCGAITRYLGELGEVVDALEPVVSRAAVARARTADLTDVEVFVGELDDVPAERTYQTVLVVGVLEWIAGGDPDRGRYLDFLRGIEERLLPDGVLVCAIENQLGVKYLAGAPEDHSGIPFDGIQGYKHGAPARTFSRSELTALMHGAGFTPAFLHAFPDYKMTHTLFADQIFDEPPLKRVVRDAPPMPSIDRGQGGARPLDELRCWETLCGAELGRETANSFVVVCSRAAAESSASVDGSIGRPPWFATFVSTEHRQAAYGVCTRLEPSGEGGYTFRRVLVEPTAAARSGRVIHALVDAPLVHGDHFRHAFPSTSTRWEEGIRRWAALVWDDDYAGGGDFDLLPRNLLLTDDGELISIDREWRHPSWGPLDILGRGLLYEIPDLAEGVRLDENSFDRTVRDRILRVGTLIGLDPHSGWIENTMLKERSLHAELQGRDPVHAAFTQETKDWEAWVHLLLGRALRPAPPSTSYRGRVPAPLRRAFRRMRPRR